ncbi:MAG: glycosyltransferase family 4 protein [Bacteroidales bacterium]|nr:glycosyltransferase family 4 protein [Bacteroidales bacterium]
MYYKILFILHIPPPVHGSSMVGKLIKDSKIVNSSIDGHYINLGTSFTIDEIGKKAFIKSTRYFLIIVRVFMQLITFKPDLCYLAITAKGTAFFKDAIVALLIKLFRIKIVYHFHNKGVSAKQDKWVYNFMYRLVFKDAHAILLSKYLYPDIQKYFSKKRVYYCPNGIAESKFEKDQLEIGSEKPVEILFLSNLIESKGVLVLLEACLILKEKRIPFHCTYVGGEGDITSDYFNKKVSDLKLNKQVFYAGKKYGEEKAEAFEKANIFAFPTYYHNECFPLVLLEAMQQGLPVITTCEGGISDIVEDGITGYLVPQKDAVALAEKLEILINDSTLRHEMGAKGRARYEEQFTLNTFENRLTDILNSIVNKNEQSEHS